MPRSYRQYCSLARALDLVGERWTLLIARELIGGPRRYKDLLAGLPGIGTNLLASRLKDLETAGLIEQTALPPPLSVQAYCLTPRGAALEPALVALAGWGLPLLDEPRNKDHWLPRWNHLAFKARFNPEAARGIRETYAFEIENYPHYVVVNDGTVATYEGRPPDPAFTITFSQDTFLDALAGVRTFEDAIAAGDIRFTGDFDAFRRCTAIFQT